MSAKILFYSVSDEYGEFSNFAPYPIRVSGKRWPTSEHYFKAHKFRDPKIRESIRTANSPMEAARMGRDRRYRIRRDWDSVRVGVMREALRAKFTQHVELRSLLMSTGDATIVEHTENDAFWGDGGDGSGANMLGRLLMDLRNELRV
jgi:N-glycosidase YbiA